MVAGRESHQPSANGGTTALADSIGRRVLPAMKPGIQDMSGFFVGMAFRHPLAVVLAAVVGVALSLLLTVTHLAFHTNRLDLISAGNRYKQLDEALSREFEALPERVVVVIRSEHPEQAKAFATAAPSSTTTTSATSSTRCGWTGTGSIPAPTSRTRTTPWSLPRSRSSITSAASWRSGKASAFWTSAAAGAA